MSDKPKGLKLRGGIWWIDKIIHTRSGERVTVRESTRCRTLQDAIRVLERRQSEIEQQEALDLAPAERTFTEAAVEYLIDLERRGKSTTRQHVDLKYLMPEIGHLPLGHIHQRTLQPWIDRQRGRLSSNSVRHALATVSTILRFAAHVLRDGHEPWLKIAPPKLRPPDWGVRKPKPITWEEQDALLASLPPGLAAPIAFLAATGARHSEVLLMQWDWHRPMPDTPQWSVWWVPPEVRKASSKDAVSDREGRYLLANAAAREVLARQVGLDDTWVFPSGRGSHYYTFNTSTWREAVQALNLKIRPHDLRHTFGLRAADAGIPLDARRSLLGHRHADITLHYSSPGLKRLLFEVEKIVRPD